LADIRSCFKHKLRLNILRNFAS